MIFVYYNYEYSWQYTKLYMSLEDWYNFADFDCSECVWMVPGMEEE